jgi:hypothetical protein
MFWNWLRLIGSAIGVVFGIKDTWSCLQAVMA